MSVFRGVYAVWYFTAVLLLPVGTEPAATVTNDVQILRPEQTSPSLQDQHRELAKTVQTLEAKMHKLEDGALLEWAKSQEAIRKTHERSFWVFLIVILMFGILLWRREARIKS